MITKEDSPYLSLNRIVINEFRRYKKEGTLKLSTTKHSALIKFVSCFPSILPKPDSYDVAGDGLAYNGIVNSKLYSYPDLHALV